MILANVYNATDLRRQYRIYAMQRYEVGFEEKK